MRNRTRIAVLVLLVMTIALPAHGRYVGPGVQNVPLERLIPNLEKQLAQDPKSIGPRECLARAHAMAWALKSESVPVSRNGTVWYGGSLNSLDAPTKVAETEDEGKKKAAREHLDQSIEFYRGILEQEPALTASRLGYAWVLAQAGNREPAVAEESATELGFEGHFLTPEAAGYLIPLLDPERDAAEIRTLQERVKKLAGIKKQKPRSPIAVALTDGLTPAAVLDPTAHVRFDLDGSGADREWEWITPDAAWLVFDPQSTGRIESGRQLFGNVTFWMFWEDGYAALRALDDDGDGRLSGPELRGFALWHDRDRNGSSGPSEVRPLDAWGIVALECRPTTREGAVLGHPSGAVLADGRVRPTWDLILRPASRRR